MFVSLIQVWRWILLQHQQQQDSRTTTIKSGKMKKNASNNLFRNLDLGMKCQVAVFFGTRRYMD